MALIVNNKPCCPNCNEKDVNKLKVIQSDIGIIDSEKYFEIVIRCRKCKRESYYFLDLNMQERIAVDKKSCRYTRSLDEE